MSMLTFCGKKVLRGYQSRIISKVANTNAIVVLPTGAGKTLIASSVIAQLKNDCRKSERFRALMLVPTCLLVQQQSRSLEEDVPNATIAMYSGDRAVPNDTFNVLVSTPEAFRLLSLNDSTGFSLKTFHLLVIDEVHHVVKRHPYRMIARMFMQLKSQERPQVLGLTASLTYAVSRFDMQTDIEDLCAELDIKEIATANDEELVSDGYHGYTASSVAHETLQQGKRRWAATVPSHWTLPTDKTFAVHEIREEFFYTVQNQSAHPLSLALMECIGHFESEIATHDKAFSSPMESSGKLGKVKNWGMYAYKRAKAKSNEGLIEMYQHLEDLYEAVRIAVVSHQLDAEISFVFLDMMVEHRQLSLDRLPMSLQQAATVLKRERMEWDSKAGGRNLRLSELKHELIVQRNRFDTSLRGIIFVQQRVVAHVVEWFINTDKDLKRFLNTSLVYATSTPATPTLRLSATQSKQALETFRVGSSNILVSTSVSEEGMDVPAANAVFRFDPIQTPVSLVQSRGRARQSGSAFVILKESGDPRRSSKALQAAEEEQRKLIGISGGFNCPKAVIQAIQRRTLAQQSCLSTAREYLLTAQQSGKVAGAPVQALNEFAKKIKEDVEIKFTKVKSSREWRCRQTLHFEGKSISEMATKGSKKDAKMTTAVAILRRLTKELK